MKHIKLDKDEREVLESVERGAWKRVSLTSKEKARYIQAARNTLKKDRRINIRLSQNDLEGLKLTAVRQGLPYQTLVTGILHQYVTRQWQSLPSAQA